MIVLNIISWITLVLSTFFFGTGIFVLKEDKSKWICALFTCGYFITMMMYIIK